MYACRYKIKLPGTVNKMTMKNLLLVLLLAAFVALLENYQQQQQGSSTTTVSSLFPPSLLATAFSTAVGGRTCTRTCTRSCTRAISHVTASSIAAPTKNPSTKTALFETQQQQNEAIETYSKTNETIIEDIHRRRRPLPASGGTLSPYQILYPDCFENGDPGTTDQQQQQCPSLPLSSSLTMMRRALTVLLEQLEEGENGASESLLSSSWWFGSGDPNAVRSRILRVEQRVSTGEDPLGWLHAQHLGEGERGETHNKNSMLSQPAMYMNINQEADSPRDNDANHDKGATASDTIETACLGSAVTVQKSQQQHLLWELQPYLPPQARFYGGERFDRVDNNSDDQMDKGSSGNDKEGINMAQQAVGHEWKDFGQAFWMLPAMELRKQTNGATTTTTLAVHLYNPNENNNNKSVAAVAEGWRKTLREQLALLARVTDRTSPSVPPTTLHPVLRRDSEYGRSSGVDGQELYEHGVVNALKELEQNRLQKVVLAQQQKMHFCASETSGSGGAADDWTALDVMRRWKYGGLHEGGHMFWMRPVAPSPMPTSPSCPEFFGCTPERLFSIQQQPQQRHRKHSNENEENDNHNDINTVRTVVRSEALAGTRQRGSTPQADEALMQDLFASRKDRRENVLTGRYIESAFEELAQHGWIDWNFTASGTQLGDNDSNSNSTSNFFVRRLLHVQHICRRFQADLTRTDIVTDVAKYLLSRLHPTPAVCGVPLEKAQAFIRQYESTGFDRGFYAGPIGYIGKDSVDILVAIRSALLTRSEENSRSPETTVRVYAGAGIVNGSTLQGEWAETNHKMEVVSSLFPSSPVTLRSGTPTPNSVWATAFIEELVRCGVTRYYICPGSRSTPLVVAIAKAVRSHVGIVHAISVHDERAAAFRALGYGRSSNTPAAVITSSGTAVANLYPAVIEAGIDGVPMLVLTADRPYENRDTGANQAIDQTKIFSSTYVRWHRDILPPDDAVPVSAAFSDADHAVSISKELRGPVHLNIQFRENLAPDGGSIRNDNRVDSITQFNVNRFTDVPGFTRWSTRGGQWTKYLGASSSTSIADPVTALEVANLIAQSKRGIIVVGSLREPSMESDPQYQIRMAQTISYFAQVTGFPIIAGVQSAGLRFISNSVVPFAEHILKCPMVGDNLNPDLVLQIGTRLVSSEIPKAIEASMRKSGESSVNHVLLHPHHPGERADPDFTVTHRVNVEVSPFLKQVLSVLSASDGALLKLCSSELAPLVLIGRKLRTQMKNIIHEAAESVLTDKLSQVSSLTEPEIVVAISEYFTKAKHGRSLFLSNSMPIRDAEFFLYPMHNHGDGILAEDGSGPKQVGTNRGASGIDGIVSSALGFAESTEMPTTLLIGDMATMHDLNSFHSLANDIVGSNSKSGSGKIRHPLTTIVVNNDGGGIFSFLPIAQHGSDVSFEEFFGTPTSSFSFDSGARAFGLPVKQVSEFETFQDEYNKAQRSGQHFILEAKVAGREVNVAVHKEITKTVDSFVMDILGEGFRSRPQDGLPIKIYSRDKASQGEMKTLVLLHGWLGDKNEWDNVCSFLMKNLSTDWRIMTIDLPGHGAAPLLKSSESQVLRSCLQLDKPGVESAKTSLSVDGMAKSVLATLSQYGVEKVDGLAGYSLGGRVALAMKRLSRGYGGSATIPTPLRSDTKIILLSSFPGDFTADTNDLERAREQQERTIKDDLLEVEIDSLCNKGCLLPSANSQNKVLWDGFLQRWYSQPLWGNLNKKKNSFLNLKRKRYLALSRRGRDLAAVISHCSPPRNSQKDWRLCSGNNTLFVAGSLDSKYVMVGETWHQLKGINFKELSGVGHALLVESPSQVARTLIEFISGYNVDETRDISGYTVDETRENISKASKPLSQKTALPDERLQMASKRPPPNNEVGSKLKERATISIRDSNSNSCLESLEFESFSLNLEDSNRKGKPVLGIGWGRDAAARESNESTVRSGFIVEIISGKGSEVGIGEVSPLAGVHPESLEAAKEQLLAIQKCIHRGKEREQLTFEPMQILGLDGELKRYIDILSKCSGIADILPSVKSGIEMALLSLSAQKIGVPIHQAISADEIIQSPNRAILPLNGLIPRGSLTFGSRRYPSFKVKVGHRQFSEDMSVVSRAFQFAERYPGPVSGMLRMDANQAWSSSEAIEFATSLDGLDLHAVDRIEFIEEPLKKQDNSAAWSFAEQVGALERWYRHTDIFYALDETLADLVAQQLGRIESIEAELKKTFADGQRGCRAFVIKPALLGVETSVQIARLARKELGIAAVFSSSFDSGIGLAYTAFLGSYTDTISSTSPTYPHGIGTFELLAGDTLSPPFASYVDNEGNVNVRSLSRALYGLRLDEIRDPDIDISPSPTSPLKFEATKSDTYEASAATSSNGEELSVVVSLSLPFSADIAYSRFTDLPQHSRWSPWISSVTYQGKETEWTLKVRGIPLKWRATSELLEEPWPGIQWESVSGLKNRGFVEFVAESDSNCHMNVRMIVVAPSILRKYFKRTTLFLEDFLRDKLMKWSLESFRDTVKADLALERGDVELGDALYGAVESKASAIEATLSNPPTLNGDGETNKQ